jgi:translation elongation factor aEF-1 beta
MAKAIITFKLMPESPEVDRKPIAEKALAIAKENGAIGQMQTKEDPIGYGLVAILILAMYDVNSSDFEAIAVKMAGIPDVESAEVAKMDLALG